MQPERYDVVVFKYPRAPIEKNTPKNYIKRLLGLAGRDPRHLLRPASTAGSRPRARRPCSTTATSTRGSSGKASSCTSNDEKSRKLLRRGRVHDPPQAAGRDAGPAAHRLRQRLSGRRTSSASPTRWNPDAKQRLESDKAHSFVHNGGHERSRLAALPAPPPAQRRARPRTWMSSRSSSPTPWVTTVTSFSARTSARRPG